MVDFWVRTLSLLAEKKLRKQDVIDRTGIKSSTFHTWIKRDVIPAADDAVKIADLLGVSVRYLCTGESEGELPYRTKALVEVLKALPEEDIISIGEFVAILKKNAWRKKGGVSVPPDADATVVG